MADAAGRPTGLIRLEAVLGFPLVALLDAAVIAKNQMPSPDVKAAQATLAASLLAAGEPAIEVISLINALNDDLTRRPGVSAMLNTTAFDRSGMR